MITRAEIRRIPELHKSILRDKEQLIFLREKATAIPSTLPDHERVQTSPSGGGNRYVEAAIDLNKDILRKELLLAELQAKAREYIESLPNETETERLIHKILRYRYLKCYTWEETAELLGYYERHIRRLEYQVVSQIEKDLP